MSFVIILASILLLVFLISYWKIDAFISFIIVSLVAGIALGIPVGDVPDVVNRGIGNIMSGLTLILIFGAMLGKLVAESGAARKIANVMVGAFGTRHIQWGLMVTGFAVGIPLFYNIGFILLVPIIFSVAFQYKFPVVYIGLPMLASCISFRWFISACRCWPPCRWRMACCHRIRRRSLWWPSWMPI